MPIYEYHCEACGEDTEVLQKLSDAPATKCPHCGKDKLVKMVSASSFQLKGSGWYVTDFRDKGSKSSDSKKSSSTSKDSKKKTEKKTEKAKSASDD